MLRGTSATKRRGLAGDARGDLTRGRIFEIERHAVDELPCDPLRGRGSVLPAVRSHQRHLWRFAFDHAGDSILASRNAPEMPVVSTLGSDADHEDKIECRWFHSLRVHPQFGGRSSAIAPFDKSYPRSLAPLVTSPHPAHSGAGVCWTIGERELRLPSNWYHQLGWKGAELAARRMGRAAERMHGGCSGIRLRVGGGSRHGDAESCRRHLPYRWQRGAVEAASPSSTHGPAAPLPDVMPKACKKSTMPKACNNNGGTRHEPCPAL